MDVVGGFLLADGRRAKALTGVDDHSRFCVSAYLTFRETSQRVCDGLALAMRSHGVPEAGWLLAGFVSTTRRAPTGECYETLPRQATQEHHRWKVSPIRRI